jgi:large subunit ribosomal protein L10
MAISKTKKKEILDKAKGIASDSPSIVFVNFKGIKVSDTSNMRKELRKLGVKFNVFKKTLLSKALSEHKIEGVMPELEGEIAVAYQAEKAGDILAPAREVYSFVKKFKDSLSIVGGVFEGKYIGKEDMVSIATIPGRQVLIGQFVNLINSPIQGLVISLDKIAEKKTN